MMRLLVRATLIVFLVPLSLAPVVLAQQQRQKSTNYIIPTDVQPVGGGEAAKSTNYVLDDTIGEANIGESETVNYLLNAGYRQTLETYIAISCGTSVSIGTIAFTGQRTGSGSCNIITDAAAGYSLSWTATGASMVSGANTIGAYTPAVANTPETWYVAPVASEWGGRLRSNSTDAAAEWGTDGSSDKWLNIATSARTIVTRSSRTDVSGSTEIIQYRTEIGAQKNQPTGNYSVGVTVTATSL
jgi:hypothetical protein